MNLIWTACGRTWGFRFRRLGGFEAPRVVYDDVFSHVEDEPELYSRVGEKVVLGLSDPLKRKGISGRVISHGFTLFGALADRVNSIEHGRKEICPLAAGELSRDWDDSKPPPASR